MDLAGSSRLTPRNQFFKKMIIRALAISISLILFVNYTTAQPVWVNPYPNVIDVNAANGLLNVNLTNLTGDITIYYIVYRFNANATAPTIKARSSDPPDPGIGGFRGGGSFTYSLADDGTVMQVMFENLIPNIATNTILIAVEYAPDTFIAVQKINFSTPACPTIDILTGFSQPQQCVNIGADARFNVVVLDPDPNLNGIIRGTEWTLDWGDGTVDYYTSATDNDLPPLSVRTHTYSTTTDCNYVFSNVVDNQCGDNKK